MHRKATACLLTATLVSGITCAPALATDGFEPPAGYYNGAMGTGATLKTQLYDAMRSGHIQRRYGDFRNSSKIHDRDPNNPSNILLVYNRFSIFGNWDSGSTWNREHVWPQSRQPGSTSNSSTGNLGDPHSLLPCNPSINSSRSNKPFGFADTTGNFGSQGSYYFPGDADKGDIARSLFYSDARWGPERSISLVRGFPGTNQMGDLDALIAWHYLDIPDTFERRRNHTIATQSENPAFYTNNRNAFVDHPEFAWSIYQDQENDSQLFVGASADSNGFSMTTIDLGAVFVGDNSLPNATFTINKAGNDGTFFTISVSGDLSPDSLAAYDAFPMITFGNDQKMLSFELDPAASSLAGFVFGTVTVNNLDVTTEGGAGHGANDLDDTVNVELVVLDRANGSFASGSDINTFTHNFGTIAMDGGDARVMFNIHNFAGTPGFTAGLDVELASMSGDTDELTTDFTPIAGLAPGAPMVFEATLVDDSEGEFIATITLNVFDDRTIDGFTMGTPLVIELSGIVEGTLCLGDCDDSGTVDFNDLVSMLFEFGSMSSGTCDADESGMVDFNDLVSALFVFGPCE